MHDWRQFNPIGPGAKVRASFLLARALPAQNAALFQSNSSETAGENCLQTGLELKELGGTYTQNHTYRVPVQSVQLECYLLK